MMTEDLLENIKDDLSLMAGAGITAALKRNPFYPLILAIGISRATFFEIPTE